MALGLLRVIFIIMAIVSASGIILLYQVKDQKIKSCLFCFLVIWGLGIAFMSASSFPSNYLAQQAIAWIFGFLAIAALVIKMTKPKNIKLAKFLITISIFGGMIFLLFF